MKDRYEEALALARQGKSIEEIFPELRESEDERIRKWIASYIHRGAFNEEEYPMALKAIEYLEKQKEQKPISFNEPYNPDDYEVVMEGNATGLKRKEQKPVEGDNETEIQKAFREGKSAGRKEVFDHPEEYGLQKPAEWSEEDETKLRDVVRLVEDSGHVKSIREHYEKFLTSLPERFNLQPKQEWSEEDEDYMKDLMDYFGHNLPLEHTPHAVRDWLKSLRPQSSSQSNTNHTVWHNASEEKPTKLPIIHIWYHGNRVDAVTHEDTCLQAELDDINFQPDDKWAYVEDLLNVQSNWKPSEEQMDALKYFVNHHQGLANQLTTKWDDFEELKSLYEDLKHLYINSKKWKR